ncbi:beta strand repeat-containing protein [Parvicella tangerina]|uniref:Trimeric autotransporter adhesin YadA-like head domain-containing protein n=1 Tax=Parvicella tangerina TaxID=2829795 RepID=A0A916JKK7_9FLAO|nr:hypothetical protein [Parvicella tangerina]CAG5079532.1 hypothetical protein CRYO30217_00968 [Parvicella tangerina]
MNCLKNILYLLVGILMLNSSAFAQVEYTSTGSGGAYSLAIPANINALTPGLSFTFKANHVSANPSTLNVNGLGAVTIMKGVSTNLDVNDILAGQVVTVVYDGTNFQMTSAPGSIGASGSDSVIADADSDTEINVEAAADQDVIHFNLGDNAGYPAAEYFTMIGPRLEVINSGNSVFFGAGAGANDNLASNGNAFIGTNAGNSNLDGQNNVAVGLDAMQAHTSGYNNTAIGRAAMYSTTTGTHNTALGSDVLYLNTTGTSNVGAGYQALGYNITGSGNVALGQFALRTNSAGNNGTAIGHNAMQYANDNVASFNNENVALGFSALRGSITAAANTGNGNVAVGYQTLLNFTTAQYNVAVGSNSLFTNDTGDDNIAVGAYSLYSNTSGVRNVAMGRNALQMNTTGNYNVGIGYQALALTTGSNNTAVGYVSGSNITSGIGNTFLGYRVGIGNTTGANNTIVGTESGDVNATGSNNVLIGYNAELSANGLNNAIAIGSNAEVGADNSLVLGSINGVNGATADTKVGIGTTVPAVSLDVAGTDAIKVPVGTTIQRPGTPTKGMIRFNDDVISYEAYDGTSWVSLGGAGGDFFADGSVPMTGGLDMNNNYIVNLNDPINPQDAATMNYVDNTISGWLTDYISRWGDSMQGDLDMTSNYITNLADPTAAQDAATKNYVDLAVSGAGDFFADGSVAMTGNFQSGGNFISNDGGNEGIGIATNGEVSATPATTGAGNIAFRSYGDIWTQGQATGIYFTNANIGITGNDGNAGGMHFRTSGSERLTILAGGAVGIGTSTPAEKLEVAGNISIQNDAQRFVRGGSGGDMIPVAYGVINDGVLQTNASEGDITVQKMAIGHYRLTYNGSRTFTGLGEFALNLTVADQTSGGNAMMANYNYFGQTAGSEHVDIYIWDLMGGGSPNPTDGVVTFELLVK